MVALASGEVAGEAHREVAMQAQDIMTRNVVTVAPETTIVDIAGLLIKNRISAVIVVDADQRPLGIVSEGDLIRRPELETEAHRSWWLQLFGAPEGQLGDYIKSHARRAREVMSGTVVSVTEEATLDDIASTLERHHIKRVPVVRGGKLVGVVSRADLLRGLAARVPVRAATPDDRTLREAVEEEIARAGVDHPFMSVIVAEGVVRLWGAVRTEQEKTAARVAAEAVTGVKEVQDELRVLPASVRAALWAE